MSSLVDRAHDLAELIEAHADASEHDRRLARPTVDALTDAGLMRMCVPAEYGGPAADPAELAQAIEAVSYADGAAGWCSMISSTTSSMAVYLPASTAQLIYGDPGIVTGGVFAPNGRGTSVDVDGGDGGGCDVDGRDVGGRDVGGRGFSVEGRWAWGSGTQHSDWVLGGVRCDDDTFRLCWFDHSDVTFHDTWHTSGMRGSGSLDYSVHDVVVTPDFTMQPGVTKPVVDGALSRFPNFTLLAAGVSAVALGIGRRALDELLDIAQGKKPQYSSKTLAQSPYTHIEVARAEAKLRSARAFLLDELATAWSIAEAGDDVPIEARLAIRLAATNAAAVGADVADTAYTLAGGTAVYDTSLLGRCLRDAHVVTQHIQTAPKLNETIGRLLLGQDVDTRMF